MTSQPCTLECGEKEQWMVEIERSIERSLYKWELAMDPDAPEWVPPVNRHLDKHIPTRPNRNILIHQLSRYSTPSERTAFYVYY
jgi:hypothetical protein